MAAAVEAILNVLAAAFFTTYEALKETLPTLSTTFVNSPALTHMTAASGGELVSLVLIAH